MGTSASRSKGAPVSDPTGKRASTTPVDFSIDEKFNPAAIRRTDVVLPDAETFNKGRLAFLLHNVLTAHECESLIAETERRGYSPALVNTFGGNVLMPDVRNNTRCMVDDPALAGELFRRIRPFLPAEFKSRYVEELNERLRFLRYKPGQKFAAHQDGTYPRPASHPKHGDISLLTVHVYLNGGYRGGSTRFLSSDCEDDPSAEKKYDVNVDVGGEPGSVLVFEHPILHQGSELAEGTKYTVRTDVMYSKRLRSVAPGVGAVEAEGKGSWDGRPAAGEHHGGSEGTGGGGGTGGGAGDGRGAGDGQGEGEGVER